MKLRPARPTVLTLLLSLSLASTTLNAAAAVKAIDPYNVPVVVKANNRPETLQANARIKLSFGPEQLIIPGGLQPSMLVTQTGTRVVQSQMPERPFPSKRQASNWAMGTYISRNEGKDWTRIPLKPGENGLNMEGGAIQLRDGLIFALDTFITPSSRPEIGLGQIYTSNDDWKTLDGPIEAIFHLPGVVYSGSSDDAGRPYQAARAHRRILELPNGDLLTTLYGWFQGDEARSGYMPTMKKTRVFLVRSSDRGRNWNLISTVAVGPDVGTEGYGEAVLERIRKGPHAGRLLCHMRTGRELRETYSDDEGKTWVPAYPRVFADLDVYRTEKWADMFRGSLDKSGKPIDNNPVELIGAVVDPDLLVLRSGVIVATFGVRVPPRACWPRAEHPWNGNYLAISLDDGKTWDHVVRLNSGVLTTHYTAIEETPTDNKIYLAYDLGDWRSGQGRSTYGRTVDISLSR